ncbi:glycosyl hydrolase family 65 protein [Eubacterium sp.]|uniref:glycosyl hydrolase family 65 protein n=1 Tax=Eubacterium sp. TaxID=142586 RepID=UPI00399A596C
MYYYDTKRDSTGLWIEENKYRQKYTKKSESVFTTENGYMGIRGTQDFPTIAECKGMFVRGFFSKATKDEVVELINCPNLSEVYITTKGKVISLDTCKIENYNRKFNVETGELVFQCDFLLENNIINIKSRRFVSYSDLHLFCQQLVITLADGNDLDMAVKVGINGQMTNSGVAHIRRTECRVHNNTVMEYIGNTDDSEIDIMMALDYEGTDDAKNYGLERRSIYEKRKIKLVKNKPVTLTKYAMVFTNVEEPDITKTDKISRIIENRKKGFAKLFDEHLQEIYKFWKNAEIKIDGISVEDEAAIKYSQLQLFGMIPKDTDRVSIAAKGLSGEGYKGHVFWDSEIYMLPFFCYTNPEMAKRLLIYRYNGLSGAFKKAKEYGYKGAMYPWESAFEGKEETPLFAALNIETGKANPVWSGRKEHHVSADIAYAIINYYHMTKDEEFMRKYGYEMLIEISKFWESRSAEKNGRLEILDIIGPDEYDEHIDNNTFTNYMAKYCVGQTLIELKKLKENDNNFYKKLSDKTKYEDNILGLEEFVRNIYIPQVNKDGIIPQDDTFLSKKELPDIDKYKNSQVKQSVLLDYTRDQVVDTQAIKQADVVMLLNLFPQLYSPDIVKKNVLFYEKRTLHDSSLSYCAHAQACANIGELDMAQNFFKKALEVDLVDNPYDSTDGLHAAAMGGIYNCLIQGFAGVSADDSALYITPHLPKEWKKMEFVVMYKGCRLEIRVSHDKVDIYKTGDTSYPLCISINNNIMTMEANQQQLSA